MELSTRWTWWPASLAWLLVRRELSGQKLAGLLPMLDEVPCSVVNSSAGIPGMACMLPGMALHVQLAFHANDDKS